MDIGDIEGFGYMEGSFQQSNNVAQEQVQTEVCSVPGTGSQYDEEGFSEYEEDRVESVLIVDGVGSFDAIDFAALTLVDVQKIEFVDLQAAYEFYNEYGRIRGFSVRKSKTGRCMKLGSEGEILWQFFCMCKAREREGNNSGKGGGDSEMEHT